ncbi:MAG: hypothetical protein M0R06_00270 [Sphaerochaeta sp.]|jgi:hypothetical protein|nr:hypothetical protein [Sphaerochaeta sp.]
MRKTQNKLRYNHAELDFAAMRQTAAYAYGKTVQDIYRNYDKLIHADVSKETVVLRMCSEQLETEAKKLVIIAETLATLNGAAERDELTIVNRGKELQ